MPAAVPGLCACVIRVETCFDYRSIVWYFAPSWLPLIFSDFFPRSALQSSATYVLVSSTGNVDSLQEASSRNRLPFLFISTLRRLALDRNKLNCVCKSSCPRIDHT